jgi:hypothetical protein
MVLLAFLLEAFLICFLAHVVLQFDFETLLTGAAIAMLPPRRATLRIIGMNLFMINTSYLIAVVLVLKIRIGGDCLR